ncbi:UNVERIFIED_CONTAM: hypothetical protein K2H54_062264, partial [Gekko kuhli]
GLWCSKPSLISWLQEEGLFLQGSTEDPRSAGDVWGTKAEGEHSRVSLGGVTETAPLSSEGREKMQAGKRTLEKGDPSRAPQDQIAEPQIIPSNGKKRRKSTTCGNHLSLDGHQGIFRGEECDPWLECENSFSQGHALASLLSQPLPPAQPSLPPAPARHIVSAPSFSQR